MKRLTECHERTPEGIKKAMGDLTDWVGGEGEVVRTVYQQRHKERSALHTHLI